MFSGIMDAVRYGAIIDASLVAFIADYFPDGHRYQMDNDPKHHSSYIESYFDDRNINWWLRPPDSPDLFVGDTEAVFVFHTQTENLRGTETRSFKFLTNFNTCCVSQVH